MFSCRAKGLNKFSCRIVVVDLHLYSLAFMHSYIVVICVTRTKKINTYMYLCIYTVIRQTYEKTEKVSLTVRVWWDLCFKSPPTKGLFPNYFCVLCHHCVYTPRACLDHPVDGRGPNRGGNYIKKRNKKHIKLMNTGDEDFLLTRYF